MIIIHPHHLNHEPRTIIISFLPCLNPPDAPNGTSIASLDIRAQALHKSLMKAPVDTDWTPRYNLEYLLNLASHLPAKENKILTDILLGNLPKPPLTLSDLGYEFDSFCDIFQQAESIRKDPVQFEDNLKVLEKAALVGALARPKPWKRGSTLFGQKVIPQSTFLVYKHDSDAKPRLVTDLARKPQKAFSLKSTLRNFPKHDKWIRDLFDRSGGKPSYNDLYEKSEKSMEYQSLQDIIAYVFGASKGRMMVKNDWKAWYFQI